MDFELITIIVFILGLSLFLFLKRKKLELAKILFPFIYVIMYKTEWGLKFMERLGKKHRALIQFIGYCGIGIGFVGMILVGWSLIQNIIQLLFVSGAQNALQPVLPGVSVAGLGKLSFWHWIISIFVLAVVHESAHGIVAFSHDVKVKSSGAAIFALGLPLLPAAFVEPDEVQLAKKDDAAQYSVFAAGPLSNLVLGVILIILMGFAVPRIDPFFLEPIGVSMIAIDGQYPASELFKERTTVDAVDGKKVTDANAFLAEVQCLVPGKSVELTTTNGNQVLTPVDNPDHKGKGFLGVTQLQNEFKNTNEVWSKIYFWFKDLFKWIAMLNIFIGVANLIPLGPLDGGHMMRTLLTGIHKKEKGEKYAHWISLFMLVLILGSFVIGFVK